MSELVVKRKPKVDDAAAAAEQSRQADLDSNDAYRRGVAFAEAQARSNAQHALNSGLADLKRTTLRRDETQAGRDSYNRCYREVVKRAERVAAIMENSLVDGKVIEGAVSIPSWIPPPAPTAEQTVVVRAPRVDTGYRESKGHGPSGGLPLRGPGSQIDPDWLETTHKVSEK